MRLYEHIHLLTGEYWKTAVFNAVDDLQYASIHALDAISGE